MTATSYHQLSGSIFDLKRSMNQTSWKGAKEGEKRYSVAGWVNWCSQVTNNLLASSSPHQEAIEGRAGSEFWTKISILAAIQCRWRERKDDRLEESGHECSISFGMKHVKSARFDRNERNIQLNWTWKFERLFVFYGTINWWDKRFGFKLPWTGSFTSHWIKSIVKNNNKKWYYFQSAVK